MLRLTTTALFLVLAACGGNEDSASPAATQQGVPSQDAPVIADPAAADPGEEIELRFPTELDRGVCWYMHERQTDGGWSEPQYHLLAAPQNGGSDRTPGWQEDPTEFECFDIGVTGAGPDAIVVPDTASPGEYRLCTENTPGGPYCTTILVTEPRA